MKSQVLRYDQNEDDAGKVTSRFMIVAVTDPAFAGAIARSEHTFTDEENAMAEDGLVGEVTETIAAEALDKLKVENETKAKAPISSDAHELTSIAAEIRPEYVLSKQEVLEENRKKPQPDPIEIGPPDPIEIGPTGPPIIIKR